ncbi:MAG: ferritin-like domain-containing protein [Pseudomonadota bacterium]|nr:ferritin-like domain-containing protein [Pseudomonadota bacterium]
MNEAGTLTARLAGVLRTAGAVDKAGAARRLVADYRAGRLAERGDVPAPARPARPARPELRLPRDMPKRRKAGTAASRFALVHALAHIELNAIDLSVDIALRFGAGLPDGFSADWLDVADDEARHFLLLERRLNDLGGTYGDLPAHDGLWQAAGDTTHDVLARLAVAHMVLEARGLDVTPAMIGRLERAGDADTAAILRIILEDEIGHVATGRRWFGELAGEGVADLPQLWRELVRRHFRGALKPPFNTAARRRVGMDEDWYGPLVD